VWYDIFFLNPRSGLFTNLWLCSADQVQRTIFRIGPIPVRPITARSNPLDRIR
jgi:hypothetical protein